MFGYVKPWQPELRVKELDAYKAVYCGLCGQLGRSFGPIARLTLSYDFAFLSMLCYSVQKDTPCVERRRCYTNPLKRCTVCMGGEGLALGADVAAITLYYKLLDNIQDGGPLTRLGFRLLQPIAASARKKAAARRPEEEALVADSIARQNALERAGTDSIDAACEPTAAMMGGILRRLSEDETQQRVLERFGYLLGRYIYLCDALDDLWDDVKSGSYNPLALRHRLTAKGGDWAAAREEAVASLYLTIAEAQKALALLALHDFAPIIENIVNLGLRASVDEIQSKKEKDQ